jgi:peptidoglycan/xylan/chitin deacetylase (PgdA/CDA1 family)
MQRAVSIVLYHDVSAEKNPLTSHLSVSTFPDLFRSHMVYLAKNFDVIGADELISNRLPARPLLVTFDDAYRSIVSTAGPILKELGIPSVFSVIAAAVQDDFLPIDNLLSLAVEVMGLQRVLCLGFPGASGISSVIQLISQRVPAMRPAEIAAAKIRLLSEMEMTEASARQMSQTFVEPLDLRRLSDYRIEIGNHSLSHSFFRGLTRDELEIEIGGSCRRLEDLSGQKVRCLSIPYGNWLDTTEEVLDVAHASGHAAIFLVHARSNRFRSHHDTYYRVDLENVGLAKMPIVLGVLPILRSLRHGLR